MLAGQTKSETKGYRPKTDVRTNTFNKVMRHGRQRCLIKPEGRKEYNGDDYRHSHCPPLYCPAHT